MYKASKLASVFYVSDKYLATAHYTVQAQRKMSSGYAVKSKVQTTRLDDASPRKIGAFYILVVTLCGRSNFQLIQLGTFRNKMQYKQWILPGSRRLHCHTYIEDDSSLFQSCNLAPTATSNYVFEVAHFKWQHCL